MSVILNLWTCSAAVLTCSVILNLYSDEMPYYLLELPYLFNLFADRAEASLERKTPSSKKLQFLSVLIFRLTKPIVFQVYFKEFNIVQLYESVVDVTIFASFFYMIPFKYWQQLRNHRFSGNIINTLDAFGSAEVMIYLVQSTLKSASFSQYILIVTISNLIESIISWVMYKNEGSEESLQNFLQSIQQTIFIELKCCFMNILCFALLHSSTQISNIMYNLIYSKSQFSRNIKLLEYFTNFIYVEDSIKSFNISSSTSSISLNSNLSQQESKSTVSIPSNNLQQIELKQPQKDFQLVEQLNLKNTELFLKHSFNNYPYNKSHERFKQKAKHHHHHHFQHK
ncbi:transmembrane protein, putative (macronuclear) [Tetrahymena thermophila SB210]|uniref:Transmembrane protein, putative n=1 Tax=Tetrahymena thermophila (strain SB210) TaxID=312017 RepID=I7LY84_TETTS|nr:transmembrane protein, putative [Tetrahymena thermophila SB210]EAS07897.1 transmembrane protein, putative [Tetrahymena thermophila SB210]|eukprot:XP_001028139.1 transmembrane protein, putative [Tetrahymena thermophila SB210]